jgi:CRISPR-associated protein Csx17
MRLCLEQLTGGQAKELLIEMYEHILYGCRTRPLSSYLKALGILRLISEQMDPQAKGWWREETFCVHTILDREELEKFFCDQYAPTPIADPWNGGSGFYLGDITEAVDAISAGSHKRFTEYRKVISEIRSWPEIPVFNTGEDILQVLRGAIEASGPGSKKKSMQGLLDAIESDAPPMIDSESRKAFQLTLAEVESQSKQSNNPDHDRWKTWWNTIKKARTKCNEIIRSENKQRILPRCRARLPESCVKWLDAICALQSDGKIAFNPVLGTGGNEGRFEFSNSFMQRLTELFISCDMDKTRKLFVSAAFNTAVAGLLNAKIGQYDPGRAGGYNQGMEIETKDFKINPWDFVLAMEGALVMASAIVRRNPTEERSQFTAPFSVRFSSVGFSSSAAEETGRRELWLPIWRRPAAYAEVKHLFGEGRSTIGRRVARTGLEFSRAVGTLGVDRGIDSFERYAFLERRGQSYVALPAGRIKVKYRPRLEIMNELDPILARVDRFLRGYKNTPATFQSARHNIAEAVFKCCQDSSVDRFSGIVRSLGKLEKLIAMRDRTKKPTLNRPLLGLSPLWIDYSDDNSIEVRIAAALSSVKATAAVGPLRSNMAEINPANPYRWSEGKGDCCWRGNSLSERLAGVLCRRLMDAERRSAPRTPVEAFLPISAQDVMPYLWGECNDAKIEDLMWGFTLIDWKKPSYRKLFDRWRSPLSDHPLSRSWCVLKLLHSAHKIRDVKVKWEPRISHLLSAGRIGEACAVAVHRLRVSGLSPYAVGYQEELNSIRLLSSLLIPISDRWRLESLILKEKLKPNNKGA